MGYILTSEVNNDSFSVWPQMNGFKRLAKNGIFGVWLETLRGITLLYGIGLPFLYVRRDFSNKKIETIAKYLKSLKIFSSLVSHRVL